MLIAKHDPPRKGKLVGEGVENTTSGGLRGVRERVRIGMVAGGCPDRLHRIKAAMAAQEQMGWHRIVSMDDEVAIIEWADERKAAILSGYPEDLT